MVILETHTILYIIYYKGDGNIESKKESHLQAFVLSYNLPHSYICITEFLSADQ